MSITRHSGSEATTKKKTALAQRNSAQEGASRRADRHSNREILANTTQAEPQRVASAPSKTMVCSSSRQHVGTSRHTLTQLSPPECLDLHNWHESHHKVHRKQGTHLPSAKVLVKKEHISCTRSVSFQAKPQFSDT